MDITLRTHTASPALALRALERWPAPPEPAQWRAWLEVRSGAFTAALSFYFDQLGLDAFRAALRHMDATLSGSAVLQTPYEEPRIELTVGRTGQIGVSGLLRDYEQGLQRLAFSFVTDQTVLRPLIDDLEAAEQLLSAGAAT